MTWPSEQHALLFYLHWHNYYWVNDQETYYLRLSNAKMHRLPETPRANAYNLKASSRNPSDFLRLLDFLVHQNASERGLPGR